MDHITSANKATPTIATLTPIPAFAPTVNPCRDSAVGVCVTNTVAVALVGPEDSLPADCFLAALVLVVECVRVAPVVLVGFDVTGRTTDDETCVPAVDGARLERTVTEAGAREDESLDAHATYTPCITNHPVETVVALAATASIVGVVTCKLHPRPEA